MSEYTLQECSFSVTLAFKFSFPLLAKTLLFPVQNTSVISEFSLAPSVLSPARVMSGERRTGLVDDLVPIKGGEYLNSVALCPLWL